MSVASAVQDFIQGIHVKAGKVTAGFGIGVVCRP